MPMALLINVLVLLCFFFFYPSIYFDDVAKAAIASLFFVSNIYFWKEGGNYFGRDLELNPLLHTWSLSVEEQFYLIFPFLLVMMFWLVRHIALKFILMLAGIATSLFLAVSFAPSMESVAAFYLLPPRMYELAIGSLIALFIFYWPGHKVRNTKFLQEIGLIFVIVPVFIFDKNTPFPSYYALLPCVGAGLVILSNSRHSLASKVLSSSVPVFIGLISYSLYLWHWPIIVFKNWIAKDDSNLLVDVILIAFTVVLSFITYKYVESPFRRKSFISDEKLVKWAGVCFLSVFVFSYGLFAMGNSRVVDPTGEIDSTYQGAIRENPYQLNCFEKVRHTGKFHSCEFPGDNKPEGKRIFVWGDSHGNAFMPILTKLAKNNRVEFSNNSGCPPVLNLKRTDLSQSCPHISQVIFDNIVDKKYDLVIFVAAYSNYLNYGIVGHLDATHKRNIVESHKDFSDLVSKTLNDFEKREIPFLIVVQPPRMRSSIPEDYLRAETRGSKYLGESISLTQYESQIQPLFEAIPKKWHKNMISMPDVYCPEGRCVSMLNGALLFADSHHISNYYADYLVDFFTPIIDKKLNDH